MRFTKLEQACSQKDSWSAAHHGTAHSSDSCETQTCDGSAGSGLARLPSCTEPSSSVLHSESVCRARLVGVCGSGGATASAAGGGVSQRTAGASHGCCNACSAVSRRVGSCRSSDTMNSRPAGDTCDRHGSAAKEARWLSVSVAELKGKQPESST